MLQTFTVEPGTLLLLKRLQALDELRNTVLVEGTALALRIGYRHSIDIDLFGEVDMNDIEQALRDQHFTDFEIISNSKSIKQYVIEGIKVDIVNYKYKWIKPNVEIEGVKFASLEDIAAMKVSAITGRGSRKDFIDIYFLLNIFTFEDMIGFYVAKYPESSLFMVYKSLTYFVDADKQDMPKMFENVTWEQVKAKIIKCVENL